MRVRLDPRQWPGRVIPETDHEIDTAVEAFCLRAGWADAHRGALREVAAPWFAEGWSVDALLMAVDRRPDGARQGAPRHRDQVAHDFLRARLRSWWEGGARRARPPVEGMTLGRWWRINRRNARLNQPRPAVPLGEEGNRAREASKERVRARLRDPVQRSRERGRRYQEVLDSLLVPGLRVPTFDDSRRLLAEIPINEHPVCSRCGCRVEAVRRAA
ncbi:hypothetical protein [Saccharothrix coeruleofusca]|uniref:Uncharacterized protein n=1 Tax=Saccharothrix coeruleofusca TaxID=33919 RepID=A0A918EF85_9PSEU|nr:hypothetical protein [Saccharothrix coeruleofusca]MBP2335320.1 hypothetical protein [Saccharothrix coeruleofusca]GGP72161.1 hypothetical protein GCM10010185_51960 [Saccharothrix coeruleofusca]